MWREVIAVTVLSNWFCGCSSGNKASPSQPRPQSAAEPRQQSAERNRVFDVVENPGGVTGSRGISAAVLPLGEIPYDNLVLPIVSPDGRFVATQTGTAPTWPTILAQQDAIVPTVTQVMIYELDRRPGIAPSEIQQPQRVAILADPVLIGRSCDEEGFIVESPQRDGSRWIGKASWETGRITWLVTSDHVNAFASIGPQNQLAWSRRSTNASHFDLMVRIGADEWTIQSEGNDWVLPSWSGRDNGLFVYYLKSRQLAVCHTTASSPFSFRQAIRQLPISNAATIYTAYQCISGMGALVPATDTGVEQHLFFHPDANRVVIWRSDASGNLRLIELPPGSLSADVDSGGVAFITMADGLEFMDLSRPGISVPLPIGKTVLQSREEAGERSTAVLIPRHTPTAKLPILLLAPNDGRVGLMAVSLLPK